MMNEIYVLISGAYSDWRIEGFVEGEEEAIKTCIAYNEMEKEAEGDAYDSWDEIYYLKASKFNEVDPEKIKEIRPLYEYRIMAWKNNESWTFQDEDKITVNAVEESHPNDVRFYKGGFVGGATATVHLTLDTLDREKALKIAQDMLYKKLAEKEGL